MVVHLKNKQLVTFRARESLDAIVSNSEKKKTTLTEWLKFNKDSDEGRHLTYLTFPSEFVWYKDGKGWKKRTKLNKPVIGRLTYIHPAYGEVFYLRMLLCHKKGCKSFQDIRTVGYNIYPTYRSACEALGLLGDDKEWTIALEEAKISATSIELRLLFAHILILCDVSDPLKLWKKHWKEMADDIPVRISSSTHIRNVHVNNLELEGYVLYELEMILNRSSKSVKDFALPLPPQHLLDDIRNKLLMEEKNYNRDILMTERCSFVSKLNERQKIIYNLIMNASTNNLQELIFVYGHGKNFPLENSNYCIKI